MKAEIIAVGTELLLGEVVNTNAAYISSLLASVGIDVYYHTTVGDNMQRLVDCIRTAAGRSELIIMTGGLGPTADDITREAVAKAFTRELAVDETLVHNIEAKFRAMHRTMSVNNRRQAELPSGAVPIHNPAGTAPGFYLETESVITVCLPGVPAELEAMMKESVLEFLSRRASSREEGGVIISTVLHFIGIGESALEEKVRDLMESPNPTIAPYASLGEVRLRLTAKARNEEEAHRLLAPLEKAVLDRVGEYLYGRGDDTLERVVGRLLSENRLTLALAESCTGGLIGHRITEVAGSSSYFDRGLVTYSNKAKNELLGVPDQILKEYGAVSRETAEAMAKGARKRAGTDVSLAVTGIAGPGGGTLEKPVGLVYLAVDGPLGTWCEESRFIGRRSTVKYRTSQSGLDLLRKYLLALCQGEGGGSGEEEKPNQVSKL